MRNLENTLIYRIISACLSCVLVVTFAVPPRQVYAQSVLNLPAPGTMIKMSTPYNPTIVKGITIYPDNPLKFDFIIEPGDDRLQGEDLEKEANKLIKYFMASLTVPESEMWVNLSPYEKDRIIADGLSKTELGRDLLSQDYILKQLTASLMSPEENLGEEFWQKVYKKAQMRYGTSEIPMNTFNKVWIIPEKANVYVSGNNVFVINNHLKVMLEEDYLALERNFGHNNHGVGEISDNQVKEINDVSSEIVREVIIPEIEKEVNQGKNFANLRQAFNSMILATWYKQNLKESLLTQVYVNQNKIKGIDLEDKQIKKKIYNHYVEAFEKGVYNYIKEDYDEAIQEIIPRKYFSGGIRGVQEQVGELPRLARETDVLNGDESRFSVEFSRIEHEALHQEAAIREVLEKRYLRQQLALGRNRGQVDDEIRDARLANLDLFLVPDYVTEDGISVYIDQFLFNHAGKDRRAVYVKSHAEVPLKLSELRLWENFIIDQGIMDPEQIRRGGGGTALLGWANNDIEGISISEKRELLVRTYYEILSQGLQVDGREQEAARLRQNIDRLVEVFQAKTSDNIDFDFFIAGPGPAGAVQRHDDFFLRVMRFPNVVKQMLRFEVIPDQTMRMAIAEIVDWANGPFAQVLEMESLTNTDREILISIEVYKILAAVQRSPQQFREQAPLLWSKLEEWAIVEGEQYGESLNVLDVFGFTSQAEFSSHLVSRLEENRLKLPGQTGPKGNYNPDVLQVDRNYSVSELTNLYNFEISTEGLRAAFRIFVPGSDVDQLIRVLSSEASVRSVNFSEGVLTIHTENEVVKIHERSLEINERMGLLDRIYVRDLNVSSVEYVVKVYKRDSRDEERVSTKPIYVLGVTRFGHDSAAVLLKDGKVVGAIEEERLDRNKHTEKIFPHLAVEYLLDKHQIQWEDINHIAMGWDNNFYENTHHSRAPFLAFSDQVVDETGWSDTGRRLEKYNPSGYQEYVGSFAKTMGSDYIPPITFVKHHKAHAASAWNTSPFKDSPTLIVNIDGMGEDDTTTIWLGEDGKMQEVYRSVYPHSLGLVYGVVTKYLGYQYHDEGIVMGLAPFGFPEGSEEVGRVESLRALFRNLIQFDKTTGGLRINPDYLDFENKSFGEVVFHPDILDELKRLGLPEAGPGVLGANIKPEDRSHRPYINLSYVLQERTEEVIKELIDHYLNKHPQTARANHLVMAGGLGLNIKSNGRLVEEGVVDADKFFVPAFPGDNGTPVGAAISVSQEEYGVNAFHEMEHVSLGRTYTNTEIKNTFDRFGLLEGVDYESLEGDEQLVDIVATMLNRGETVAWFQGGSEFGPRALGNRSFLHLLSDEEGKTKMNIVKGREWWRPSAPSIQVDVAGEYLEGINTSPFMTVAYPVKPENRDAFVSGTHPYKGDNTARPQTVSRDANPLYWSLLEAIGKAEGGIPGLLNTSFNRSEPIVETPEEALNTLANTEGVNYLAIGHFIVHKSEKLLPSVLSASEEETTRELFDVVVANDDIDDQRWDALVSELDNLVRTREINHQHYITFHLRHLSGKHAFVEVPIFKEMFQRRYQKIIVEYISRRLKMASNGGLLLSVGVSSSTYQGAVLEMFQRFSPAYLDLEFSLDDVIDPSLPSEVVSRYQIIRVFRGEGGSAANTFLARERATGNTVVIKYADWEGVAGNGIPWTIEQPNRISNLKTGVSDTVSEMFPEILSASQGDGYAYYIMPYYPGAGLLTNLLNGDMTESQFVESSGGLMSSLFRGMYSRDLTAAGPDYLLNMLGSRIESREGMLSRRAGPLYEHVVKGSKPVGVMLTTGGVENLFDDVTYIFEELSGQGDVVINGRRYLNYSKILEILRRESERLASVDPTYVNRFYHGDLTAVNAHREHSGAMKLLDVRVPSSDDERLDPTFDMAKYIFSLMWDAVRKDMLGVDVAHNDEEMSLFVTVSPGHTDTISALVSAHEQLLLSFRDNPDIQARFKNDPNWESRLRLFEAMHFIADAPHRVRGDPSGEHGLIFYAFGIVLLNQWLADNGFSDSVQAQPDVGWIRTLKEKRKRSGFIDNTQLDVEPFDKGGIDLNPNNLELNVEGNNIDLDFFINSQILNGESIEGLFPVIINVSPISNIPMFFGEIENSDDTAQSKQLSLR